MALPTANAIAQALLGNLLLNDHVAAGFVFHVHDVENLGDEVVLKGDALPLEVGVTKQRMTAGLLANLPVLILLDSQFKPGSYACTTCEYTNAGILSEWFIQVNRAIINRMLYPANNAERTRAKVVACFKALLHELAHWAIRAYGWHTHHPPQGKATPPKMVAKQGKAPESGHYFEMKVFGGTLTMIWDIDGSIRGLVYTDPINKKLHIVPEDWMDTLLTQTPSLNSQHFRLLNSWPKIDDAYLNNPRVYVGQYRTDIEPQDDYAIECEQDVFSYIAPRD